MGEQSGIGRHPIQVVALQSGLTADLLRAWEKRHGVVIPVRTDSGRRLYSDDDIARLKLIREALSTGRRIGDIATLSRAELEEFVSADRAAVPAPASGGSDAAEINGFVQDALRAARAYDAEALRALLQRALVMVDPQTFIDHHIAPLMHAIGDLWARGEIKPGQEHLATTVVRRIVEDLYLALQSGRAGPHLVVATPAGQRHDLGAVLVAAAASLEGWRVTYLGADLPGAEITEAVRLTGADAVALSITTVDPQLAETVGQMRRNLGRDFPILVGGQGATVLDAEPKLGTVLLSGLSSLRAVLSALRDGHHTSSLA